MKKIALFLLFIISNSYLFYAQPSIQWQRSLGGSVDDRAYSIQQTTDGGYIISGFSNSNDGDVTGHHGTNSLNDYWIVKLDSTGTIQWQKSLGGTYIDYANSIRQTTDGGYIVGGTTNSNDGDVTGIHGTIGADDYWIVKLDGIGTIQWQKPLGGNSGDEAFSIDQTSDEGYIVAGDSYSNDGDVTGHHGNGDYWIVKLDRAGTIQWQKSLGGTADDYAISIQQTADGGFVVAGYSSSNDGDVTGNHGGADYWIVKLDSENVIQWQKSLGGTNDDRATSIKQTTDGGYFVAGYSFSTDGDVTTHHGYEDYWIVKLNSTGTIKWQKSLGGTNVDRAISIQQTPDGGCIVSGFSLSNNGDVTGNHGNDDCWIVKLDSTLAIQWQKSVGGSLGDAASSIQQTNDGGYIVAGHSDSNDGDVTGNHGESDFWIVKLSSLVNVNEIQNSILDFQITPNPFSGETVISFTFSSSKNVEFNIYDIEGRVIKNLNSKNLSNGTNEILWDATNNTGSKVDNGIYFITIVSDNISETKKVVVLRN